jgi:hypothetical protein
MLFPSLLDCPMRRSISPGSRRAPPRPSTCRLAIESLEDRCTPAAMLAIGDVAILEGHDGVHHAVVQVTLTEPHGNSVTVNYSTANGSAQAGSDYNAASGKLTFSKGQTSKTILVPVRGDRLVEPDEYFSIRLSNAKGAKIARSEGYVTVGDDEPRVSINDVSALEGNSGTAPLTFTVSLSRAYDLPVTVDYAMTDGSATAGLDYTAAGGPLTFAPGQTSQLITVAVNGDRVAEPDEAFSVNLTSTDSYAEISKRTGAGTIWDNEPRISISDAYNYGETTFTFTVSLAVPYDELVTVDFASVDGTAIAGVDYVATAGTLTFGVGETILTITVDVLDTTSMPDKYFYIHLSGASSNALMMNEWAAGYWYYDYGYYDYGYYDYGYYDYGYYDYYYY